MVTFLTRPAPAVTVDADHVERAGRRRRSIATGDIRRIHVFVDANGDDCLVVRGRHFRLLHVSRAELHDGRVQRGVHALLAAAGAGTRIDPDVEDYLRSISPVPPA